MPSLLHPSPSFCAWCPFLGVEVHARISQRVLESSAGTGQHKAAPHPGILVDNCLAFVDPNRSPSVKMKSASIVATRHRQEQSQQPSLGSNQPSKLTGRQETLPGESQPSTFPRKSSRRKLAWQKTRSLFSSWGMSKLVVPFEACRKPPSDDLTLTIRVPTQSEGNKGVHQVKETDCSQI